MSNQITLLISSGNGPGECQQAAGQVLRLIAQDAAHHGLSIDTVLTPGRNGPKSAVAVINGPQSDQFAARWLGTIQWQARSTLRSHHKRQNWFVGVFTLATGQGTTIIDPADVSYQTFRAGGPGGQHQNTTDSAVRATHRPTGLTAVARDERSQHRNKAQALKQLQDLANAKDAAARSEAQQSANQHHHALARGNPIRRFKGPAFKEVDIT